MLPGIIKRCQAASKHIIDIIYNLVVFFSISSEIKSRLPGNDFFISYFKYFVINIFVIVGNNDSVKISCLWIISIDYYVF